MKNKYIELLHNEVQKLETKVAKLKDSKNVSFSFFRESFKQTQEIMRLLHELEFVQVEDMKSQMEKLVNFLSETETPLAKPSEGSKKNDVKAEDSNSDKNKAVLPISSFSTSSDITESFSEDENKKRITEYNPIKEDTPVDTFSTTSKSLNDLLPANHTLLDTKQSISLNDRFLFQRELFDNDRLAMNNMMIRLQGFRTYEERELYLRENTGWDFKDETVEKFLEMLKKSS
jgi:hypothetical protein